MRVLVCGSLAWNDRAAIEQELRGLPADSVILEGEAPGADIMARQIAEELGLEVWPYPKDQRLGKGADRSRDQQMFYEGQPTLVLIFHEDIENSRGSKEQRQRAMKRQVAYKVIGSNG